MPNKPEPLFIDGHYHYTLSSYEPVEVTLTVPHLTDEEVGYGIAGIVAERGWNDDDLPTDAWIAENVEGINTLAELQQAVREELEQINARYVESTKAGLCAKELARRVEQRIPAESIERARDTVRQGFEMQAMQNGVDLAQLLAARPRRLPSRTPRLTPSWTSTPSTWMRRSSLASWGCRPRTPRPSSRRRASTATTRT